MSFYIRKTRVTVTFSFLLVTTMLLCMDKVGIGWMLLISIACHEAAHMAVMKMLGIPIEQIGFYPFGVQIKRGKNTAGYVKEAQVYLAGCVFSLMIAAASFKILPMLSAVNFAIGIFNLIPIPPLDGGQAALVLLKNRLSDETANRISLFISAAVILPLSCAAVILLKNGGNFSLIVTLIFLVGGVISNR